MVFMHHMYCMVALRRNVQNRSLDGDRKWVSGCQGPGRGWAGQGQGEWRVIGQGRRVFFLGDLNVLELGSGDRRTTF